MEEAAVVEQEVTKTSEEELRMSMERGKRGVAVGPDNYLCRYGEFLGELVVEFLTGVL